MKKIILNEKIYDITDAFYEKLMEAKKVDKNNDINTILAEIETKIILDDGFELNDKQRKFIEDNFARYIEKANEIRKSGKSNSSTIDIIAQIIEKELNYDTKAIEKFTNEVFMELEKRGITKLTQEQKMRIFDKIKNNHFLNNSFNHTSPDKIVDEIEKELEIEQGKKQNKNLSEAQTKFNEYIYDDDNNNSLDFFKYRFKTTDINEILNNKEMMTKSLKSVLNAYIFTQSADEIENKNMKFSSCIGLISYMHEMLDEIIICHNDLKVIKGSLNLYAKSKKNKKSFEEAYSKIEDIYNDCVSDLKGRFNELTNYLNTDYGRTPDEICLNLWNMQEKLDNTWENIKVIKSIIGKIINEMKEEISEFKKNDPEENKVFELTQSESFQKYYKLLEKFSNRNHMDDIKESIDSFLRTNGVYRGFHRFNFNKKSDLFGSEIKLRVRNGMLKFINEKFIDESKDFEDINIKKLFNSREVRKMEDMLENNSIGYVTNSENAFSKIVQLLGTIEELNAKFKSKGYYITYAGESKVHVREYSGFGCPLFYIVIVPNVLTTKKIDTSFIDTIKSQRA